MTLKYHFASDNTAAMVPEAWDALAEANAGFAAAYGDDAWTDKASNLIRDVFETHCDVYFVFTGTAANSLGLASMCRAQDRIICHQHAHIATAECGGPGFFSGGAGMELLAGDGCKITPGAIEKVLHQRFDFHFQIHKVISITQSTEMGTVYSVDEIEAIGKLAKARNLHLHMDGARFANAVASLNVTPKAITWRAGVDVLSFGATKLGLAAGDVIVFFNKDLAGAFAHRTKQAGQVASKMRFLTAPWVGILENGSWLDYAKKANRCAKYLGEKLEKLDDTELLAPVESNAVFVDLSPATHQSMAERGWVYHVMIGERGARLMCSWDTTEAIINEFIADLTQAGRGQG